MTIHIEQIELSPYSHTVVNTQTGACVDVGPTWAVACEIADGLMRSLACPYHVRPTQLADLAELYDHRLVSVGN